jgi:hypothetical protein
MLQKLVEHFEKRAKVPTGDNKALGIDLGMSPFDFVVVSLGVTGILVAFIRVIFHI